MYTYTNIGTLGFVVKYVWLWAGPPLAVCCTVKPKFPSNGIVKQSIYNFRVLLIYSSEERDETSAKYKLILF